jgi:molybdopterin converting factor small subunit
VTIELPDGATVATAVDALARSYEPIARMRSQLAVAVDERYAAPNTALRDDCTIALIPPVSGG